MSLGVLNNLSAMYAANNLNNTNNSLSKTLQQLSSGSKINSGADDAAGLSLVNGLQANSTALSQSQTNAQEGVGLAASGRWRSLASDEPAQPCRDAGHRGLERHPQRRADDCGEPGVPVDPGRNQQHRQRPPPTTGKQVFGQAQPDVNIYTGDSTSTSATTDALNFSRTSIPRESRRCEWHSGLRSGTPSLTRAPLASDRR